MLLKDWTSRPSSSLDSSMRRTVRSPLAMRWVPAARAWTGALISRARRKPNQVAPRKMSMVLRLRSCLYSPTPLAISSRRSRKPGPTSAPSTR